MSKHTQGPWEVKPAHDKGRPYDFDIIGDRVKHLRSVDSVCWLATAKGNATDGGIAEANARLIAAAPELLQACKRALDEICDGNDVKECDDPDCLACELSKAIAKAENS